MSGRSYSSGGGSSANSSFNEGYRRDSYESGSSGRGRGGYMRDGGRGGDNRGGYRGGYRGSYRGGRGGYPPNTHDSYSSYGIYRDDHSRDSFSSPSAQSHGSDSYRTESESHRQGSSSTAIEATPVSHHSEMPAEQKRESIQEADTYPHRSSKDEFSSTSYRGGRGSYRGFYRGGYKPRDGYSPYRRESYNPHGTSTLDSRANSFNNASPYPEAESPLTRTDSNQKPIHKSPWIKLLRLDASKNDNPETSAKLKELIEEQESIYEDQEKIKTQIREQKIKNLKIQMEIGVLKACAEKDALNVELTQEKLDTISFL